MVAFVQNLLTSWLSSDNVLQPKNGVRSRAPRLFGKVRKIPFMKSIHDSWAFRWRGRLGILLVGPLVLGVILSEPLIRDGSPAALAMKIAGWLFFMLYLTFRIWATLFLGGRKDSELQTEGPYSATRNPLYVGSFCLFLSLVFFFRSIALVAMLIIGYFIYTRLVIRAEERFLADRFGDSFESYRKETPRFFPSFSKYRSPENVVVSLKAMKTEAQRLWIAALLPVVVEVIMHFRSSPSWPHLFRLP